jgi:hypothetical protein
MNWIKVGEKKDFVANLEYYFRICLQYCGNRIHRIKHNTSPGWFLSSCHPDLELFFLSRFHPIPGHGLPLCGFAITFFGHIALGRTSLDEWLARRRDLYLKTHNAHTKQTSMPSAGLEPAIPGTERPQTHALIRAATGIGTRVRTTSAESS